jgi:ribonuclease HI
MAWSASLFRMSEAVIYTDGACSGNPGPGGWGVVLQYGSVVKELHGGDPQTTNNRMELTAVISALEALNRPVPVTLYTDSRYVLDGVTKWLPGWQRNGWRTAGKQPVKNVDLWQRLVAAMARHEVTWRWVKGHNGDPGNERADELARLGITEALAATHLQDLRDRRAAAGSTCRFMITGSSQRYSRKTPHDHDPRPSRYPTGYEEGRRARETSAFQLP